MLCFSSLSHSQYIHLILSFNLSLSELPVSFSFPYSSSIPSPPSLLSTSLQSQSTPSPVPSSSSPSCSLPDSSFAHFIHGLFYLSPFSPCRVYLMCSPGLLYLYHFALFVPFHSSSSFTTHWLLADLLFLHYIC